MPAYYYFLQGGKQSSHDLGESPNLLRLIWYQALHNEMDRTLQKFVAFLEWNLSFTFSVELYKVSLAQLDCLIFEL